MFKLHTSVASLSAVAVAASLGLAPVDEAVAEMSDFSTSLTALSGSSFQLNENFSILYDLNTAYLDLDNDNNPDQAVDIGFGNYLGDYLDPEYYVLDFALPGTGTELRPFFMGEELTGAATVDWRLSYALTPGDDSTIYSTILSGSADSFGGGLILNITDGLEWPVNGWAIPDVGIPLYTHWAAEIADFESFTFTYDGNLSANVIPAPGAMALLAVCGVAGRRRRG